MSKEELDTKQQEYIEMMEAKFQEQRSKSIGLNSNFEEKIKYKIEEFIIKDKEKTRQALLALAEELGDV